MDRFLDGVISKTINGKRDVYNPALFYGESSGTKEIVDRLIRDYRAAHPSHKVIHISAEEFVRRFIRSIKDNTDLDFGKQFAYTNLLVFENVEEIAGKMATMQVFYGVFDKVYESGGQIVLTSSAPPSKIITLEDRVRTQLEGGIMCEVHAKDSEGRGKDDYKGCENNER